MAKPLLSIGIIFKNEIRCLERCLKSLRPLRDAIPCELVMADTGAADGSRVVAEKYADILVDFEWINDFSAARNAVMDRCSGKWFMFIDCDEWLGDDLSGLIRFVTQDESYTYGAVTVRNYHTLDLEKSDDYADFTACRLLRMSSGLRFVGKIHEHWPPDSNGEQHILQIQTALFHHDGYVYADPVETRAKHDRNMALLIERLEENPEDLATLMQCIESGEERSDYWDFIKRGVAGVEARRSGWEVLGPPILRYSVIAAFKSGRYETIEEDIARAERMFPDSMYTRLDVEFVAFGRSWAKDDYPDCIRRGRQYLKAWEDYQAGNYNPMDILCSTLSTTSSSFKMQVAIFLSAAYLYEKEPEKCLSLVSELDGGRMTLKHVGDVIRTCAHLHSRSQLDTSLVIARLWTQINQPTPSEERAEQRRSEFIRLSSELFLPAYRADEKGREDFCRHSYTLFLPLKGQCVLGNAAAVLEERQPAALERLIAETDELNLLPISALAHALKQGAAFPLPDKPLKMEEMDILAGRLSQDRESLHLLAMQAAGSVSQKSVQELAWARSLVLADIQTANWKEETQADSNMKTVQAFTTVERLFLPRYYTAETLCAENINVLPPMHRFGWYCIQAFDALDAGNAAGYVRLLRNGLSVCEGAKDTVQFLADHTSQIQAPEPSAELLALAEQIRTVLAGFAPDDPAVAALKRSEAYQKAAFLIEGLEVPVVGGQLQ